MRLFVKSIISNHMKRLYILFAILAIVACDKLGKKDYSKELEAINNAKVEAVDAIQSAKTEAVSSARSEISQTITKAMEGANNDLASAINSAKDEIKSSVQESVNKAMESQLKNLTSEVAEAKRLSGITGLIALVAILFAIGAIIYAILVSKELRKTEEGSLLRDSVVRIVKDSDRIQSYFSSLAQPSANKSLTKSDVELIVSKALANKQVVATAPQKTGETLRTGQEGSKTPKVGYINEQPAEPQSPTPAEPVNTKIELFAKDSSSDVLSGVQSTFQQGKSIYKLILASKDERYADLTLYLDQNVQRRILNASDDFLTPVCKVERKSSDPQSVTVSSMGKAERISGDTWKVVNPISVVLS